MKQYSAHHQCQPSAASGSLTQIGAVSILRALLPLHGLPSAAALGVTLFFATPYRASAQQPTPIVPAEAQALDLLRQLQAAPAVPGAEQVDHPTTAASQVSPQSQPAQSAQPPSLLPPDLSNPTQTIPGQPPVSAGPAAIQPGISTPPDVAKPPMRQKVIQPKVRGAFEDPQGAYPAGQTASVPTAPSGTIDPTSSTQAPPNRSLPAQLPPQKSPQPGGQPSQSPQPAPTVPDSASSSDRAVPAPVAFARYNGLLERSPFEMRKREVEAPPPEAGFGEDYTLVSLMRMADRDTAILREKAGQQRTIVITSTEPEVITGQHLRIAEVLSDGSATQRGVVLQRGEDRATLRLETSGVTSGARVQTFQSPDAADSRARIRREVEENFVPFDPQVLLLAPPARWPLDPDANLHLALAFTAQGPTAHPQAWL